MASEVLAAEETREKHRWNESNKVYTRKIKNKQSSSASQSASTNSDTLTLSHGTAYVDNNGNAATSIGGDLITTNNCDVRIADKCNGVASNSGDASTVDNGVTALVNNGNIAETNDGDFVNDEGDAAIVDSGDTYIADNGDTMIVGNGNTGSTGSNSDSGKGSRAPEVEDRNSSHLDQQVQQSSILLYQVEPDPSSLQHVTESHPWQPQQLQENVLPSPQKLQEHVLLPEQQQGHVLPQKQLQKHVLPQKQLQKHVLPQKHVPPMHQLPEPVSPPEVSSDAPSDFNQMETGVEGILLEGKQNGTIMAIATRIANRVSISLMAARSSVRESRQLKRKLTEEVAAVRNLVRKLEQKEAHIVDHSGGVRINGVLGDGMHGLSGNFGNYTDMQYPANHATEQVSGIRFNSNESLVGFSKPTTHRQLTVSVIDNSHGEFLEKEKRTPKANQFFSSSDFILGKEKFPPAESNKKLKSTSKKHGGGEMNFWFGMDKHMIQSCNKLLQKLMRHKYGWVFNKPVNVKALHLYDYYDIIKHPMDLGTVKTRLSKNWYKSPRDFAEDVRLTFNNAIAYNPKGHDVHIMAEQLSQIFEVGWVHVEAEYNHRLRYDVGFPTDTSRKASLPMPAYMKRRYVSTPVAPPLHPPPWQEMRTLERSESMTLLPKPIYNGSIRRTPALRKPKANEPNKRNMTFEEKQKLSANLQAMPPEKLDNIVQIIKKRSAALNLHDDEIEVDIDSVDAETLWELDRLVANYKKSLSKYKRRAELVLQRAEAAKVFDQANPMSAQAEVPKEASQVQNNGVASPVNGDMKPDNASGGSSTSSSSSSGSGSSSSDSDSDSSSESSSEEG